MPQRHEDTKLHKVFLTQKLKDTKLHKKNFNNYLCESLCFFVSWCLGGKNFSNMEWLNYPTFVVGHPKSGTSLLISMLDNHPQLVVLPEESDFFNSVYRPLKWKFLEHYTKDEKIDIVIGQIINITHLSNF